MPITVNGKTEKYPYPKLMCDRHDGDVLLFINENCSVVLSSNGNSYQFGEINHSLDVDNFVPFDGEIILSNPL